MRAQVSVASLLVACTLGCRDHAAAKSAPDGTLVIEVGGERSSLRSALAAAGVDVEDPGSGAAMLQRDGLGAEGQVPPDDDGARDGAEQGRDPGADVDRKEVAELVVALGKGETLMQLAKKHLGSSQRYREILARNGWNDDDARRLREGQLVTIPLDRRRAEPR